MLPPQHAKQWILEFFQPSGIQSNLFNADTKGTEPSVHFTEVSVL